MAIQLSPAEAEPAAPEPVTTSLPVSQATEATPELQPEIEWTVYGAIGVRQFDYFKNALDTAPRSRREIDLERLVFEPEFKLKNDWKIEAELEFEHGGTGGSMELDGFEEFGEFETEIEQGGEVKVDKLEISNRHLKFGLITVPVGAISQRHHPTEYFTVTRNRSEGRILPSTWRSVGFGIEKSFGESVHSQTVIVQGLNSEFFRKYNWIQDGAGRKFETTFADNLAIASRWDFGSLSPFQNFGFAVYYGDSSRNRQKVDKLAVDAGVLIWDVHAFWESPTWTFRALYVRGYLQNSQEVSTANAALGGAANPGSFAALGKEAEAYFVEAGYNFANLVALPPSERLDFFVRLDQVDPMKEVAGSINRDPRFRESAITAGLNWRPEGSLVAKLQFSEIKSGLDAIPTQHEISAGFGFYFSGGD